MRSLDDQLRRQLVMARRVCCDNLIARDAYRALFRGDAFPTLRLPLDRCRCGFGHTASVPWRVACLIHEERCTEVTA